jgi:hypothetical protein
VRSWQGLPNPHANFGAGYRPTRFLCLQVGVIEGNRLIEPRPGSTPLPLSVGHEYGAGGGGCDAPSDLTRFGPLAAAVTYLEDPYAYAPLPLHTVLSGLLAPDASDPVLLGAGAPRPLRVDANRAFLAVLPGRDWDAPLRISAVIAGRTIISSVVQGPAPPAPSARQARAPDPNGGAPWGFAAGADGSSAYGRIVDGRIAAIDQQDGTLMNSPEGWSGGGSGAAARSKSQPVSFDTEGGPEAGPFGPPATLPRPEIQRRTLPGETIITATADTDVASITITTPRDVRTLRPAGPEHAIIVVYDGQFFRGAITATIRLTNGHTLTESVPNGPGGIEITPPPTPSLAHLLRRDEITLQDRRTQLARIRHANPALRRKLLHGTPYQTFQQAFREFQAIVNAEQARVAYQRAHPGLLPAP